MFLLDDRLILSASDLRQASECEFALVRQLDVVLGRCEPLQVEPDPMLSRISELGDMHEQAELRRLAAEHPGRVRSMGRATHSLAGYEAAMAATLDALSSGATVLSQATLFDGSFLGVADFLELTEEGWLVSDTKLARSANVAALLQIAAYASLLGEAGVPLAPVARLVLGSGEVSDHPLGEILPVHRLRRERLAELVLEHRSDPGPAAWGDPRWGACGRCDTCEAEVVAHRDLLLVAGMHTTTRRRLRDAGITTIDELAAWEGPVAEVRPSRLARLQGQARLQLAQEAAPEGGVLHDVIDEAALRRLPPPSDGDIFFDFEGDPLWQEPGSPVWGLEYLFGLIEVDSGAPRFSAFWAHDRAQEKAALEAFVAHVKARLRRWPRLHIYHYASYEVAALTRLAARHSTCEDDIDDFLRAGLFVDLYASVRASVRVSQRSYSIKKLEPLYMEQRQAQVQKGDDSIVQYHLYRAAQDAGQGDRARELLAGIAAYNEEDCVSTLLLRDWLVGLVGVDQVGAPGAPALERVPSDTRVAQLAREAAVRGLVEGVPVGDRSAEEQAVAMVAASVLFHAREDKPVWWRHYERIKLPTDQWQRDKGVALLESTPTLITDWHRPAGKRSDRRTWSALVEPLDGSPVEPGMVHAVYTAPTPFSPPADHDELAAHVKSPGTVQIIASVEEITPNGRQLQRVTVEENAPGGAHPQCYPVALVPTGPIGTRSIDAALDELADEVRQAYPRMVRRAGIDVLLRRPPRLRNGAGLPAVGHGEGRFIDAATAALLAMDDSYLAVQGPPGTGKTYVGARVIARLAAAGWGIGVCAQSHAAIENVLDAVVGAGVAPEQVGKHAKHTDAPAWTALASANGLAGFIAEHRGAGRGFVVGGSAWDLTNISRVARGELDLVVIDEAGQFSLAKTLAVSMAGDRLLLLGDPAQLPQVSQGTHAEPIDASALGWLTAGSDVLPSGLGYFLETTWRMHPRLTEIVSRLSYGGRLHSKEEVTTRRTLAGVEPGLHVRLVDHTDNSQWSREEASEVVTIVRDLLGRQWYDPGEPGSTAAAGPRSDPRPLTQEDIIVITPYNAQVGTIRVALRDAGLPDVPVGTVDKFQGQEAPIAILSMAASAPGDLERRGIGFLLDRHRLNVAISRGQHVVYLVRSVALTDFGPRTPRELLDLGAFIGLCDAAVETSVSTQPAHLRGEMAHA